MLPHDTDRETLACFLPRAPAGYRWRKLHVRTDRPVLRETWNGLAAAVGHTPIWTTWRHSLIFPESGDFARNYVQVIGLCMQDGPVAAVVAETEAMLHAGLSELLFYVRPQLRGQGLGQLALQAGVGMARWRGRRVAVCQFEMCAPAVACPSGLRLQSVRIRHGHCLEAHYALTRRSALLAWFCRQWKTMAARRATRGNTP